jgi:hypothetical protein
MRRSGILADRTGAVQAPAPPGRNFPVLAGLALAGFAVLTVIVRFGWLDGMDRRLAQLARPDDVWGNRQQVLGRLVNVFDPGSVSLILAVVLAFAAIRARSLRPVVAPAAAGVTGAVLVVLLKGMVGRPDPHGGISGLGSYPSGHTLTLMLGAGLALLLLWPEPRWWHLVLPVIPGVAMTVGVVITGMHRASDAAGSILLAEALIAAVAALNGVRVSSRR